MLSTILCVIGYIILSVPVGLYNWMIYRRVIDNEHTSLPDEIMLKNILLAMLLAPTVFFTVPIGIIALCILGFQKLDKLKPLSIVVWRSEETTRQLKLDAQYRLRRLLDHLRNS